MGKLQSAIHSSLSFVPSSLRKSKISRSNSLPQQQNVGDNVVPASHSLSGVTFRRLLRVTIIGAENQVQAVSGLIWSTGDDFVVVGDTLLKAQAFVSTRQNKFFAPFLLAESPGLVIYTSVADI